MLKQFHSKTASLAAAIILAVKVVSSAAIAAERTDALNGWKHSGTLAILTTPDGAALPAAAVEQGFPLLVRLNADFFDFRQAQPHGEDIRFSAEGKPLAYQIDEWDTAKGTAGIWVRIPVIKGNSRQQIAMHWGNAGAKSESSGAAVFNESNGYAAVMHLDDRANPVKDEVGTVSPVDAGTTSCPGIIGEGRRFEAGQGVACGEKITGLPSGFGPSSTEAWFKADHVNTIVVGWGNEQAQGKVIMNIHAPPHVRMECYFSNADVAGKSRLPMSEWVHVVHTYQKGDSRVYLNGRLDGVTLRSDSPLNIRAPARMWLGGWYNNYRFIGDIDEVRISKVVRSPDWIKLCYENQKPLQTLVGTLVQPGRTFAASTDRVAIDEGTNATVTAQAGGAEKVYWIVKRDGKETVVAVDRLSYTLDAGRVVGDASYLLQFKAVYPGKVKAIDIPVTIKETIPEPDFTLDAPKTWNGRDTIEVVPLLRNREAMRAAGAGELHYVWDVSGGAVIKQIASDRLILKRSQYTGRIAVSACIDNGGPPSVASTVIQVNEPKTDPWVERIPEKDEKPEEGQFYARDDKNEGTLCYNGTLGRAADAVFLKVYADDKPYRSETRRLVAGNSYAFTVKLKPGLVKYRVEFGTRTGREGKVLDTVGNLVCGDAYLIEGQSNALATDTGEESPRETNEWIRSYGGPTGRGDGTGWVRDRITEAQQAGLVRPNLWCNPVWKANRPEHKAELGWWGMELAKRLVASQRLPILIVNGAVGGTRIDEHQPTPGNHADLKTIYGRMLWRVQQARLTHGIRAVLWHQGESDQGSDGPDGGYGWETYQRYFLDMSAAWKQDFPNIRHYYVFQIWPNSCSMGNGHGDMLREVQRTLPRYYSNLDVMSTLGIRPPGPCHYPLTGWAEFARLIQPLIERDFYGRAPARPITAPNLRRACFTGGAKDAITLEFDQPVLWWDSLCGQFYLDGAAGTIASGSVSGNVVTLKLKSPSTATTITYLKEMDWSLDKLLIGANGIAALTFCDVPIDATVK
jgi:hypothetical protein